MHALSPMAMAHIAYTWYTYIYMVYYIHAYILKLKFLHLHLLAKNTQEKVLVSWCMACPIAMGQVQKALGLIRVCVCEIHVALTIDQDAARRKSIMYGDGEGVQRNKREKLQSEIIAGAELHEKSLRKIKFHIFFMLSTPSAVAASAAASHTAHRVGIRFEVVSADVAVVDGSCCCCCCCFHKHE